MIHQKEENVMKFKRITAILLSAATLAAMPTVPVLRNALPDTAITAEAADTFVTQFVDNQIMYIVYRDSSGEEYATAIAAYASATRIKLTAYASYNGKNYPIRKINTGAFANKSNLVEMNLSEAIYLQEIGENAFYGSGIRYVELNGQDLTIRKGAFQNTKRLNYVYAYSGITSLTVEENAFTDSSITDFSCYAKKLTLKSKSFDYAGYANGLSVYIYSNTDTAEIQTQAFQGSGLTNLSINCRKIIIRKNAFLDPNRPYVYAPVSYVTFNSNTRNIYLNTYSFSGLQKLETVDFKNSSASISLGTNAFSSSYIKSINLPSTTTSIPSGCFSGCSYLTSFSIPANVKTIGAGAFKNSNLPQTVNISKNTTSIADDAFTFTTGVKSFSVASDNPNFKSVSGVLFSKDGTKLLSYPQLKASTSYTTTASTIPDGAFNYSKNLKTLSIKNIVRNQGETVYFYGLENLENLSIPTSDYNGELTAILDKYNSLFTSTKVHKLNGSAIVVEPSGKKPYFNSKFSAYMKEHFEDYESYSFMKWYVDKSAEYVVSHETNAAMNDMEKAVKLHEWLMNNVEYDPLVAEANALKRQGITPPDYMNTKKNHVDASVFLHERDGHHYTVCDGYARCYRILMNKAGVKTYYVHGSDTNPDSDKAIDHAWNLVLINGYYYHVDATWDDGNTGKDRFKNFMKTDSEFNIDGHKTYNWSVWNTGAYYDPEDEIRHLDKEHGVTTYSLGNLGCFGSTPAIDQTSVDRLEAIVAGNKTPSNYEKVMGDIDFDGYLTSEDVRLLKEYIKNYKGNGYTFAAWRFETIANS